MAEIGVDEIGGPSQKQRQHNAEAEASDAAGNGGNEKVTQCPTNRKCR